MFYNPINSRRWQIQIHFIISQLYFPIQLYQSVVQGILFPVDHLFPELRLYVALYCQTTESPFSPPLVLLCMPTIFINASYSGWIHSLVLPKSMHLGKNLTICKLPYAPPLNLSHHIIYIIISMNIKAANLFTRQLTSFQNLIMSQHRQMISFLTLHWADTLNYKICALSCSRNRHHTP